MQFRLFAKETYASRRSGLRAATGSGIIVIMGNQECGMNYRDNWYPFRQDSHFLYYFGLNVAGLAAVLDTESGEDIIFGDELTIDDIVWTGPLPSLAEMAGAVGVTHVQPYSNIATVLKQAQESGRTIHFTPPYRAENRARLAAWLQLPLSGVNAAASVTLIKAIVSQRSYKEACEVEEMHQAACISADMHLAAMRFARQGMKEYEVMARIKETAFANNATLSFQPIVTINGQTLHNTYSGNTLCEGRLLLCDAGAGNDMNYAGDLTTTYPIGRTFSARQKAVYEIVLNAHTTAVSMLRPGVLFKDVYLEAARQLVLGMQALGLMKGDAAEAVAAGAHAMFFQCGLGHMIGLDVHDMEDLGEPYVGYTDTLKKSTQFGIKSLRLGRALEAGFTLTVEPGVYMIPELMDKWRAENQFTSFINYTALETWRDFGGIRVEEDYLITAGGSRLLGKKLPMTVAEVEAAREAAFGSSGVM